MLEKHSVLLFSSLYHTVVFSTIAHHSIKRSAPPPKQAAEGETVVTAVRSVRRVDIRSIEFEVVTRSGGLRGEGCCPRRPGLPVVASVSQATSRRIDKPAAHEVITNRTGRSNKVAGTLGSSL